MHPQFLLPPQVLSSVQQDVAQYENFLKKVAQSILTQNISEFPIFVLHQENEMNLGKPLIDSNTQPTQWSVNVSIIEEFLMKNIIQKPEDFKQIFKSPTDFACLFIIYGANKQASFVFIPYHHLN